MKGGDQVSLAYILTFNRLQTCQAWSWTPARPFSSFTPSISPKTVGAKLEKSDSNLTSSNERGALPGREEQNDDEFAPERIKDWCWNYFNHYYRTGTMTRQLQKPWICQRCCPTICSVCLDCCCLVDLNSNIDRQNLSDPRKKNPIVENLSDPRKKNPIVDQWKENLETVLNLENLAARWMMMPLKIRNIV